MKAGLLACVLAPLSVAAQDSADSAEALSPEETITQALAPAVGGASQLGPVRPSVIDGLYSVQIVGGPTLMVTPDGKHAVVGDLLEIAPTGFTQVQDPYLIDARKDFLAGLSDDETINFKPEGETKHVMYVFTDVDCGYCRRLHNHMHQYREKGELKPGYSDLGIEVRYLAYPRAGIGSPSAAKLESAWCADDQQAALDKLKAMQPVDQKTCESAPIARHFVTGGQLGVNATPAIMLPNGELHLGYRPPEDMVGIFAQGE
ncbi:DsbC family protein [Gilvimarinus sp. 1_MG-2023]|uniref:DsbC family protein n=1 Tax=Gilvimarinus sp. 1_MG-2023 TaxID=3062638 RepID=UPI0026E188B5|nr:DsbC family protein [Gilvimarinus sp. 1_MG-2023]MDO6747664.1 DsbC family protein [Gilvimarinus sp. 1_MG-2023]